jgi:hypothetical protein
MIHFPKTAATCAFVLIAGCAAPATTPASAAYDAFPAGCDYRAAFPAGSLVRTQARSTGSMSMQQADLNWGTVRLNAQCLCPPQGFTREQRNQFVSLGSRTNTPRQAQDETGTSTTVLREARLSVTPDGRTLIRASGTIDMGRSTSTQNVPVESVTIIGDRCLQEFHAAEIGGVSRIGRPFIDSVALRGTAVAAPAAPIAAPAAPTVSAGSIDDRLAQIRSLRERGLISEQEAAQARSRVLSGL